HLCRWLDERSLVLPSPPRIGFPSEIVERVETLENRLESLQGSHSAQQAILAAELGRRAMEAAVAGQLTDAQTLFASSLATDEHPETISAYVLLMEDLGYLELVPQRIRERSRPTTTANTARAFAALGDFYARRGEQSRAAYNYNSAADVILAKTAIEYYACFL